MEKLKNCCVCKNIMIENLVISTECLHIFHKNCIEQRFNEKILKCPQCPDKAPLIQQILDIDFKVTDKLQKNITKILKDISLNLRIRILLKKYNIQQFINQLHEIQFQSIQDHTLNLIDDDQIYKSCYWPVQKLTYKGQWKYGQQHGQGQLTSSQGFKYYGQFENGEFNGQGILYLPNGSIYKGQFINNQCDGKGTFNWSNGSTYEGQWKNDMEDGYGIMTFSDGSYYQGEWEKGQKNGQGIHFSKHGIKQNQQWYQGNRISQLV